MIGGSKARCQVHCGRGLANATFLICNCNDAGQLILPNERNVSKFYYSCKMFHVEHCDAEDFSLFLELFHVEHSSVTRSQAILYSRQLRQSSIPVKQMQLNGRKRSTWNMLNDHAALPTKRSRKSLAT